ncbi:hypothetical protein [Haladaptatus caseinilyticus]|nr:hypothetical protein [Haladaptatus caseinilyticus]
MSLSAGLALLKTIGQTACGFVLPPREESAGRLGRGKKAESRRWS